MGEMALAIDFLGSIQVAQVRNKEKKAVESLGIDKFPTLVLLSRLRCAPALTSTPSIVWLQKEQGVPDAGMSCICGSRLCLLL